MQSKNFQTSNPRRAWLTLVVVVLMAGLWVPAQAQQPGPQNRPKPDQFNDKKQDPNPPPRPMLDTMRNRDSYEAKLLAAALGLTSDQQNQIRDVYRQLGPNMNTLMKDMRFKRLALDEALFADDYNESLVTQRTKEFTDAQTQVVLLQTKIQAQVRQVLTSDQLHKFLELRQDAGPGKLQKELQREMRPARP